MIAQNDKMAININGIKNGINARSSTNIQLLSSIRDIFMQYSNVPSTSRQIIRFFNLSCIGLQTCSKIDIFPDAYKYPLDEMVIGIHDSESAMNTDKCWHNTRFSTKKILDMIDSKPNNIEFSFHGSFGFYDIQSELKFLILIDTIKISGNNNQCRLIIDYILTNYGGYLEKRVNSNYEIKSRHCDNNCSIS